MRIRAALWGGYSYAWPEESVEYPSLKDALEDWADMRTNHRGRDGLYAPLWGDISPGDPNLVNSDGRITVGLAWTYSADDPIGTYPDWQLTVGPRGGLRWEQVY